MIFKDPPAIIDSMKLPKICILLLLFISPSIFSQDLTGEELNVRLFIIGQGDPLYSQWGHTGLAIKNTSNGKDVFYDFGNFYFEDDDFFRNFAVGRLLYIAWAAYTDPYIKSIKAEERDLTEYVLNLSPEDKLDMYLALKNKVKPENRTYLYHHYDDNCSTRIRDYINDALHGQFLEQTNTQRGKTFRESFLLFTSNSKLAGSMLSLLQGPLIDKPITLWQEMFLPDVLGDVVSDFTYIDDQGNEVPLVSAVNILNKANWRKPLPAEYQAPYGTAVLVSIVLAALVLLMNIRSLGGKRKIYALSNIIAGFLLGILGSVLLFLAVFTDHTYSFNNLNLFMINPLALLIIPAAIMYLKKGEKWRGKLNLLWLIQIISTVLMILLKILTPIEQSNHLEIIIILPMLIAFSPILPVLLRKMGLLR